jgi:hypothetical protein
MRRNAEKRAFALKEKSKSAMAMDLQLGSTVYTECCGDQKRAALEGDHAKNAQGPNDDAYHDEREQQALSVWG